MKTGNAQQKRTLKQKQNCEGIGRPPQVLSTFPSIINLVYLSFLKSSYIVLLFN